MRIWTVAIVLAGLTWGVAGALARSVLVLGPGDRVEVRNDPALTAGPSATWSPWPAGATWAGATEPLRGNAARDTPGNSASAREVRSQLTRLYQDGSISISEYRTDLADFRDARQALRQLQGTRAVELGAVISNLESIASRGLLTSSRLPALFLTLERNRQWWTSGPLLAPYQRVEFTGSRMEWEYYPGQGIELQVLASFSAAHWLCSSGRRYQTACSSLLSQLIPLAAHRAGGLTWEYYFSFDGGVPPWTSAMSQGTALQALGDAYRTQGNPTYLAIGRRALAAFTTPPPAGVGVRTPIGMRYVQYSFASASGQEVINAFLQSLIGLDVYAQSTGNPLAASLFAQGNAEAMSELPAFDTGAWSLYQPNIEDDLSYHQLVTVFLKQLCAMTAGSVYCTTAAHFATYLKTPPSLRLLTRQLKARRPGVVEFTVSKVSRMGITVRYRGRRLFLTSADFTYGPHTFAIPALRSPGKYDFRLAATDLAGNYGVLDSPVEVVR